MALEKKFKKQLKDWKVHCEPFNVQFSSIGIGDEIIDCDAYKKLVEMGEEILPLIHTIYSKKFADKDHSHGYSVMKAHGFPKLIREITGKYYVIPPDIQGNVHAIEIYTKKWLSEYLESKKLI